MNEDVRDKARALGLDRLTEVNSRNSSARRPAWSVTCSAYRASWLRGRIAPPDEAHVQHGLCISHSVNLPG